MSKKESEFDRFDRMKKMERELEVQKRKSTDAFDELNNKKGGKIKSTVSPVRRNNKNYTLDLEEYEYV